jgi:hypothetical protein
MAIVTMGVIGIIGGALTTGAGLYTASKNREMQKEFLSQQENVRKENMELMKMMFSQNQQRQAQTAQFLTQSGFGDIAQLMTGGGGQPMQGQGQQVQFPGNFRG